MAHVCTVCRAGVSAHGICKPDCVGIGCVQVIDREVPAVMCSAGFVYDREQECCVMDEESEAMFSCPNAHLTATCALSSMAPVFVRTRESWSPSALPEA
ncbi:MAG: hypothetical protein KVP17_003754 [Porospora cf. gigantea B]|uniref:uncharacterized protein n=1 Tax=Porospora cf. gigantea B TaxID=2853592 RepID=UPI0035717EC2|nr:MAG: hypothetical protein KVP17_003754 [Porospora cf. gigantea B]